jgi:RNA polymerase II subunit A small phosphatase-like protein
MEAALIGLRRRLAQQQDNESRQASSSVSRVRRRHESLDAQMRRQSSTPTATSAGSPNGNAPSSLPPTTGSPNVATSPTTRARAATRDHGAPHTTSVSPPGQRERQSSNYGQPRSNSSLPPANHRRSLGGSGVSSGSSSGSSAGSTPSAGGGGGGGSLSAALTQVSQQPESSSSLPRANGASQRAGAASVNERKLAERRKMPINTSPASAMRVEPFLPKQVPEKAGKVTLILDIDETLVHASFQQNTQYDVRLTVEVGGEQGHIFVAFRPGLAQFLDAVSPLFEIVIFTASVSVYADQLMDYIDPKGKLGRLRLFRQHCTEIQGTRVKDMSLLGRPLDRLAIIDNSPAAYLFQQRNAIPIISWFDDYRDKEYARLMPMLRELAACESVYDVLDPHNCQGMR